MRANKFAQNELLLASKLRLIVELGTHWYVHGVDVGLPALRLFYINTNLVPVLLFTFAVRANKSAQNELLLASKLHLVVELRTHWHVHGVDVGLPARFWLRRRSRYSTSTRQQHYQYYCFL